MIYTAHLATRTDRALPYLRKAIGHKDPEIRRTQDGRSTAT